MIYCYGDEGGLSGKRPDGACWANCVVEARLLRRDSTELVTGLGRRPIPVAEPAAPVCADVDVVNDDCGMGNRHFSVSAALLAVVNFKAVETSHRRDGYRSRHNTPSARELLCDSPYTRRMSASSALPCFPNQLQLWEHLKALVYATPINPVQVLQERVINAYQHILEQPGLFQRLELAAPYQPPRSPDFNPLDFYLWTHLKALVYATQMDDLDTLRNSIVASCETTRDTPGIHQRIQVSMQLRVDACKENNADESSSEPASSFDNRGLRVKQLLIPPTPTPHATKMAGRATNMLERRSTLNAWSPTCQPPTLPIGGSFAICRAACQTQGLFLEPHAANQTMGTSAPKKPSCKFRRCVHFSSVHITLLKCALFTAGRCVAPTSPSPGYVAVLALVRLTKVWASLFSAGRTGSLLLVPQLLVGEFTASVVRPARVEVPARAAGRSLSAVLKTLVSVLSAARQPMRDERFCNSLYTAEPSLMSASSVRTVPEDKEQAFREASHQHMWRFQYIYL
ncbi:hypothetical protein PR048_009615 [Dryococelus australis]|uniref:Uncharacterized protein n=1 Tax=Dryococelus australis TaxID=614101 RepID=A0ABQ9I276_9NEOP|nr:hypothetical protein PR048_009615 [Dryococelus australis]